jgi:hypothetical protein
VERLAVYCADVGSIKQGNFGWAREEVPGSEIEHHRGGTEIVELVDAVADDLGAGVPVALGFECPLFVPVPEDPFRLGAARPGEGTRPWSAGAGTGALTTGLVQAAWVLAELRKRRPDDQVRFNWAEFTASGAGLFLWEAFVTDKAKAATHVDDATIAVACFTAAQPDPTSASVVTAERPLSLVGAAALWAGWSDDLQLVRVPCLVLKASPTTIDIAAPPPS